MAQSNDTAVYKNTIEFDILCLAKQSERGSSMGKFVVRKTNTGYKFELQAGNGEVIASSEVYSGEKACQKGIESVMRNAPIANFENLTEDPVKAAVNPKFEMYLDKSGEHRFRLKAKNGQVIAASEGYKSKASCLNGIESVRKNSIEAKIEKKFE